MLVGEELRRSSVTPRVEHAGVAKMRPVRSEVVMLDCLVQKTFELEQRYGTIASGSPTLVLLHPVISSIVPARLLLHKLDHQRIDPLNHPLVVTPARRRHLHSKSHLDARNLHDFL